MFVAEWRYIQSIHEIIELRNPDTLVGGFLPILRRWRCAWLSQSKVAVLRTDPFYYYLVARTRYYDRVFLDAVNDNVEYIVNIGCGTDTRSYRFEHLLKQKGVKVLECDQPEAISDKQQMTKRQGTFGHVDYMAVDLNDDAWPNFENWLSTNKAKKGLVLMEGVSPYVNTENFNRFLGLLAKELSVGTCVAYDFKLRGVKDDFGLTGRTQRPFRLEGGREEVAAYHEKFGYRLDHIEQSSELSMRLLACLATPGLPFFGEDTLIQLKVTR
jgi:methyltransferase (TIGR00027 family)